MVEARDRRRAVLCYTTSGALLLRKSQQYNKHSNTPQHATMAHMESIYKREKAAELCTRGDLLRSRGHLHEALECVGEGLALHPTSKDLGSLRDELTPLLDRLEAELEKAARRAAKRRHLKDKKKEDMMLQDAALVLGVAASCKDEAVLKKAYKKMSLRHHPDRNRGDPSATQRFQRVHDAYESFIVALPEDTGEADPADKSQYDAVAAISAFKAHLETKNIGSWENFNDVYQRIQNHPDVICVRTQGERKQAFAEYVTKRLKVERQQAKNQVRIDEARKRGVFLELLASHDFIDSKSEWRIVGPRLQEHCRAHKEERWLLLDAEDRERAFNDFVEQLRDAEKALKEEKRRKRCGAFRSLLDESALVSESHEDAGGEPVEDYRDLTWSKVDGVLRPKNDGRYKDLSSDSRKREFLEWRDAKIVPLGGVPPAKETSRSRSRGRSRRDRDRSRRSRSRDRSRRDGRSRRDRSRDRSRRR